MDSRFAGMTKGKAFAGTTNGQAFAEMTRSRGARFPLPRERRAEALGSRFRGNDGRRRQVPASGNERAEAPGSRFRANDGGDLDPGLRRDDGVLSAKVLASTPAQSP